MASEPEPVWVADGRRVWLRALTADDTPRLMELCQRLSPESRRRRFLRSSVRCDATEAQRLAAVDQVRRVAIAAVATPALDAAIIGVGRFHVESSDWAEFALLVEDAYQHLGIGRLLLDRLVSEASRRGLRGLDGHVLYENQPVLHLLRTSGYPLEVRWDGGDVLSVQLHVGPEASVGSNASTPTGAGSMA
jgi:GNAT superfamily N-acetyltransferase